MSECWLMLTAGRGPGECQLAVTGLLGRLTEEARLLGVQVSLLDVEEGPNGPVSVLVCLEGEGATRLAGEWEGSIRWTCPSPLRPGWKRKNWFVSATVSAAARPGSTHVREEDLRFEAFRASGPGGQHVNRTESAVRVTHVPSGLVAVAREERSQHRNRALATARIAAELDAVEARRKASGEQERWSRHNDLERGNEVRVYEGLKFRRVR
jgi:peptide chain release factor